MQLTERQWKTLVKDLQQHRCILLLGSRMATATHPQGQQERLSALFAEHLVAQLAAEGIAYDPTQSANLAYMAQRFLAMPKARRVDLEDEVLDFYRNHTRNVPALYARLARLPFFMAVNLSPDDYLLRAMRAAGKSGAQSAHYNFRKERNQPIEPPTETKPLVYNLLGALDDPESLVLTQEDRVEFVKSVVKGNPDIPNAVMSHFDERKTYICLGFNLENWDYRLLFDSLKVSKENLSFLPQPASQPLSPEAQSFYEDRYRFMFVETEIQGFMERLEQHFTESEQGKGPNTELTSPKKLVLLFDRNESDTRCCTALCDHLAGWVQRGAVQIWHQDMSFVGDLEQHTAQRIAEADAVLPILSAGFLSDERLMLHWLPLALRHHQERGLRIIPILHRACDTEDSELTRFAMLPTGGRPLRNWPDEDEAFKNIVEHLKTLLYD